MDGYTTEKEKKKKKESDGEQSERLSIPQTDELNVMLPSSCFDWAN